jgi:hypothetical protein
MGPAEREPHLALLGQRLVAAVAVNLPPPPAEECDDGQPHNNRERGEPSWRRPPGLICDQLEPHRSNDEPVKEMPRRWSGARLGMEIKYAQQLTLYDFEINPIHWPSSMPTTFSAPCAPPAIGRLAPSAQFAGPHPVNPLGDHDLGMLAIANIAAEDTRATLPAHRLAGTPSRAYPGWAAISRAACCAGLPSAARLRVISVCRT